MDRILTPDGRLLHDKWMRRFRVVAYACIGLAGILLLSSPAIRAELGFLGSVMSGFMGLGGVLCLLGQVFNRWMGEYAGIPLIASAFMVFGITTFAESHAAAPIVAYANLALLTGMAASMAARWRQVRAVYRLALHLSPLSG